MTVLVNLAIGVLIFSVAMLIFGVGLKLIKENMSSKKDGQ